MKTILMFFVMLGIMLATSVAVIASANNITEENITTSMDLEDPPAILSLLIEDSDIAIPDEVDLIPGDVNQINCTAQIQDLDGWDKVQDVTGRFFLNSVGYASAEDPQNNYRNDTCSITQTSATTIESICSFSVFFYAEPGVWNCTMNATDDGNFKGSGFNTTTMLSLLAMDVEDGNIDFGSLSIGTDTDTDDFTKEIINNGNVDLGLKLNVWGASFNDNHSMDCTSGYTVPGDLRVAMSGGVAYASRLQLNSTAGDGDIVGLNVTKQTSGVTGTVELVYFGMGVSATGMPSGVCNGNLMFTAYQV